jgi:hypothetical protein
MKFKQGSKKAVLQKHQQKFIRNDMAWIDLLLSKVALVFASIVILAALCHLAADAGRMDQQRQLDAIAQDFRSAIDSSWKRSSETGGNIYFFEIYEKHGLFGSGLNATVSGEYVSVSFEENGRRFSSVKPLTYKTLPFAEDTVRKELTDTFSASGNLSDPIPGSYGYTNVAEFLAALGTKEEILNTSTEIHIEKTLIYTYNLNGTGVKELEYILVYQ